MFVLTWAYCSEIPFYVDKNHWFRNHMIFGSREEALEYYKRFLKVFHNESLIVELFLLKPVSLPKD